MYAKVVDGSLVKFPYSLAEIKADNPGVSFRKELTDAIMGPLCVVRVWPDEMPDVDRRQFDRTLSDTPEFVDGKWILRWVVTPK